jgi:hypothetical protein
MSKLSLQAVTFATGLQLAYQLSAVLSRRPGASGRTCYALFMSFGSLTTSQPRTVCGASIRRLSMITAARS